MAMEALALADLEHVQSEPQPVQPPPPRAPLPWATVLSVVVGLVGVAALGASAWVYGQTQRDIMRLSTDIAQIRLSLELFNRQQGETRPDTATLDDLANRLSIIEGEWRNAPALAAVPAPAAPAEGPAESGDCMPTGTRFMVAAGDTYPVCGTGAVVSIGSIDNGYISLADGTVIAQGGNIGLPNSACMIGVVPMDGGALSGYAEIRVTC